jgi:ribosomal protein S3
VSKIEIERAASKVRIRMHTARPGIVIGKKGVEIEKTKRDLEKMIKRDVILDIQEVEKLRSMPSWLPKMWRPSWKGALLSDGP